MITTTTEVGEGVANKLAVERGRPVPQLKTSAKTGQRVKDAFEELGRLIIEFTDRLALDQ